MASVGAMHVYIYTLWAHCCISATCILIRLQRKTSNDKWQCDVDNILTSCQRDGKQMSPYITVAFREKGEGGREGEGGRRHLQRLKAVSASRDERCSDGRVAPPPPRHVIFDDVNYVTMSRNNSLLSNVRRFLDSCRHSAIVPYMYTPTDVVPVWLLRHTTRE